MVMLKFQEALAAERWEEALSFCSDRVRKGAAQWSTQKEFFAKTMPLAKVLASCRFRFWREQHKKDFHSYGLVIQLTPRNQEPLIQWHWSMFTSNNTWVIDWEPVAIDLDALIEKRKSEIAEHRKRVDAARRQLEPKLRAIKTHLTAVSESFVIGSPMFFRVELLNFGESPVHFTAGGVGYHPLRVLDQNGRPIPCIKGSAQIMMRQCELAPHSSEILADKIDLNKDYRFAKPGTYFVQFDGESLAIGEQIPSTDTRFMEDHQFISTPTKFPSNILKIEIKAEKE